MSVQTGIDIPHDVYGGLLTEIAASNMPSGGSPANLNVEFLPGLVRTRGGLQPKFNYNGIMGGPWQTRYTKSYGQVPENQSQLSLLVNPASNSAAVLANSPVNVIGRINGYGSVFPWFPYAQNPGWAGPLAKSCTQFGREYIAFSEGRYGYSLPRQWDGTNFDRVSQCGPGAGPSVGPILNALPIVASPNGITQPAAVTNSGAGNPIRAFLWSSGPGAKHSAGNIITIEYTLASTLPDSNITVGGGVELAGFASVNGVSPNGPYIVQSIQVTNTGNGNRNSFSVLATTTQNAYVTPPINASYQATVATITTTVPSSTILPQSTATITGATNATWDAAWEIQTVPLTCAVNITNTALAGGTATYTYALQINPLTNVLYAQPTAGQLVTIINSQNGGGVFNVTAAAMLTVTPSGGGGTFTILLNSSDVASAGDTGSGTVAGTVFTIDPGLVAGFNGGNPIVGNSGGGNLNGTGTVAGGLRQCAVSFITRQGYITKPSPPVNVNLPNSTNGVVVANIPIGPSNVVGRLIMFTLALTPPATTGDFFSIRQTTTTQTSVMQINDNTTTAITLNFTDSDLALGFSADYLFDLVELGESAGSFSYAGRMFWWGELNSVQEFLNMEFNGGWVIPQPSSQGPKIAGVGTDGGGANTWANPNNVTSNSAYASVTAAKNAFGQITNFLNVEQFGLAAPGSSAISNIQFSFNAFFTVLMGAPGVSLSFQLLKAGVPVGNPQFVTLTGTATSYTVGASAGTWGSAFQGSDVNAANFGVQVIALVSGFGFANTAKAMIDNVQVTISEGGTSNPLGWTPDPAFPGTGNKLVNGGEWLDAYQITCAAGTSGRISQTAFHNSDGIQFLSQSTQYSARVTALSTSAAVACVVEFFSPTQGSIAILSLTNWGTSFSTQIGDLSALLPAKIPSDMVLRISSNGGTVTDTLTIDRVEIFPTKQPINYTVLRASFSQDPESFDGVTGLIQPIFSNGEAIRSVYLLRDSMYIVCDRSTYVTKNVPGQEPAFWTVDPVSQTVGATGPNAAAGGEDWEVKVNRYGLYLYLGREPEKLSQEIQSLWNKEGIPTIINWAYGYKIWVSVDLLNKRVYIGAPVNGATEVNQMFVMDYNTLDTSEMIAQYPTLRFSPYTGRRVILEQGRKWTIWNFQKEDGSGISPIPCGAFVEQSDGTAQFQLGGDADGNVYFIDPTNRGNDNGAPVLSSYTTHFFPTQDEEQALQLRSHLHGFSFGRFYISGAGKLSIYLYTNTLSSVTDPTNPQLIDSIDLSNPAPRDKEKTYDENKAERWAVKWQSSALNNWWQAERFTRTLEVDPAELVHGDNLQ